MRAYTEKPTTTSASAEHERRRGDSHVSAGGGREAGGFSRLDGAAANGVQAAGLQALQAKADGSLAVRQLAALQPDGVSQRQAEEEDEAPMQAKPAQLQTDDEEPLQGRFDPLQRVAADEDEVQRKAATGAGQAPLATGVAGRNETGLPDSLKTGIEALSGISLDSVRVHYNSSQPAQLNALAYAQGSDIHVAPGQERHLPHEAWHVVQQAQGRVSPTLHTGGVPVNDEAALEQEADAMGGRASQYQGPAVQAKRGGQER